MTASRAGRGTRSAAFLTSVLLLCGFAFAFLGVGPASAAPGSGPTTPYASLALSEVTPSTVTSSTGNTVTVRGTVTNTFDRPIRKLIVRLQRGTPVSSTTLRTALSADPSTYDVVTPFQEITGELQPRQSIDFSVSVPLSDRGLQISRAGVYPLMANINGTPDYGGPARIADSKTLLPVLSLPADAARANQWVDPGAGVPTNPLLGSDGSVAANASQPAPFTFIWPLAAPPQQAAGTLGGETAPMRLISDAMLTSLEPEGRLGQALRAIETVAGIKHTDGDSDADTPAPGTVPSDTEGRVRSGICLAIDPDLLVTVQGIATDYEITTNPADPAAEVTGRGSSATARTWLKRLSAAASRMCVTALPYAQAGLDSLERIGDPMLKDAALGGSSDLVDQILGVTSVRGLTIPAVGTLTDEGRSLLREHHSSRAAAVVSTSVAVATEPRTGSAALGRYRSGGMPIQTYDPGVSAALGAVGAHPRVPSYIPEWQHVATRGESELSRRQTAAASLAFPMLNTAPPTGDTDPAAPTAVTGRSAFLMPPTYWAPTPADARALLDTTDVLVAAGTATVVPLSELVDDISRASTTAGLTVPGDVAPLAASGYPMIAKDLATAKRQAKLIGELQESFINAAELPFSPREYLDPLRLDLLRAASTPSTPDTTVSRVERDPRLAAVDTTLSRIKQSVSLLDPSGRYTLASERSPLLLVVRNELALPIKVRLDITAPPEITVGDMGVVEIPAQGTRQLQLPTRATSSQPATVRIGLVTSNDVPLSVPIDLSLYANAYGKPLFYITIAAAVILVLLTARRLWHRFRGEPDPADEDRPEPDEHERQLAFTSYQQRVAAERSADAGHAETEHDAAESEKSDDDRKEERR